MAVALGPDPPVGDLPTRLRLSHLLMVEAVMSGDGLSRVSEIASEALGGASVVVVVPRHGIAEGAPTATTASLLPGLRRYALAGADGVERLPALTLEEPVASGGETIGIVGVLGELRAESLSDARHFLHLIAVVTLIEIAIAQSEDQDEQTLSGAFFDDLRSGRTFSREEVVARARRLGADLTPGVVVLCARLRTQRPHHVVALITGDHPGALVQQVEGRLFAVLPAPEGSLGRAEAIETGRRLGTRLEPDGIVGLSGFYPDPADIPRALGEAELALELSQRSGAPAVVVDGDRHKPLARLLASHPEEVRSLYQRTVAPLAVHDQQYGSLLIGTLGAHLKHGGDVDATAAAIRAHRHTIVHRLERVNELTGLDCQRPEDRESLGLGLKAHKLLAPDLPR